MVSSLPFMILETVDMETPARAANSLMVINYLHDEKLHYSQHNTKAAGEIEAFGKIRVGL